MIAAAAVAAAVTIAAHPAQATAPALHRTHRTRTAIHRRRVTAIHLPVIRIKPFIYIVIRTV